MLRHSSSITFWDMASCLSEKGEFGKFVVGWVLRFIRPLLFSGSVSFDDEASGAFHPGFVICPSSPPNRRSMDYTGPVISQKWS